MDLKIGDQVVVKEWDEMVEQYGLAHSDEIDCDAGFLDVMRKWCGMAVTIAEVEPPTSWVDYVSYLIEDDEFNWSFTAHMFKEVV